MNRREAMLRELNLYPQWVLRNPSAPVVAAERAGQPETVNTGQIENREPEIVVMHEQPRAPSEEVQSAAGARRTVSLQWPELKKAVRDCTLCKLRAGCTQTVFGVGDEQADWLFVGEGPGADEDALGEPFVGQAGKLLDNMLAAIRLKRGNNVYIANIVKCRPPGNRAPEADEIASCLPYLRRQIELIRPKVIVALGKVASNALLGKDATLASLRGTTHRFQDTPLIVTYHPAYLLRSPSEKAKAWQDLCAAQKIMQEQHQTIVAG
ncbi:MAG: uracil-DNA glycosylase [Nitrosomonadales bacterium]|nr:uracil-DNA glycosylase [Nitrosomonadales bacterium]